MTSMEVTMDVQGKDQVFVSDDLDLDDDFASTTLKAGGDEEDVETGSTISMSETNEEKLHLAKKETAAVFRLRLLVFLVLLLAAVAVSVIVYFVTVNAEKDVYKNQYEGAAEKVLESFIDIGVSKLGAVSSMGVATIAHGVDHIKKWPFVTLSSFQQRSQTARKQSGSLYIHINPMVKEEQKKEWERFVASNDSYWIEEALQYQLDVGLQGFSKRSWGTPHHNFNSNKSWPIWSRDEEDGMPVHESSPGPYMPTWQTSPVFHEGTDVNENLLNSPDTREVLNASYFSESVVIGRFISSDPGDAQSANPKTARIAMMMSAARNETVYYAGDPVSVISLPIFDSFRDNRTSVAVLGAWIHWSSYFRSILPSNLKGIYVVLHDTCSGSFTYEINGEEVRPVGKSDLHDTDFDDMKRSASLDTIRSIGDGTKFGLPLSKDHCMVSIDVYPSTAFHDIYNTNAPIVMTIAVAMIFVFTACMFLIYDRLVERRQALVMHKAMQTNAIVTSLFPKNVHDRLMKQTPGLSTKNKQKEGALGVAKGQRLKGYLATSSSSNCSEEELAQAPIIADLFPNCSVLFCDIAGFTAWSSTRDPEQVFVLLQTLYQAFDRIAKRRKVFKVETIGDSYLAVCGLPEPQPKHALIMVRFAWDCLQKMRQLMTGLEVSLGPDTGGLSMRFGLHSGPVTAGVLRGDRARFQLFGDTVNTASRMESTGKRGMIQVSQATATLIAEADRQHWLIPREDKVMAKGKGMLNTFWVDPTNKRGSSSDSEDTERKEDIISTNSVLGNESAPQCVNLRLIEWMVDLLTDDIKKIVHVRRQSKTKESLTSPTYHPAEGSTCMQEVKTALEMPKFDSKKSACTSTEYSKVSLDPVVVGELREYVATIASLYKANEFHNFEHACHVTMSVKKLLKRIVAPELSAQELKKYKNQPNNLAFRLHDYTHGIVSDPLLMFAITFSALIHDVDHRGCSNMQLASEAPALAERYSNKSIAEQNSLDISWEILMQPQFGSLRRCLFVSQPDLLRFRQIIVNTVLATDIFDKELNDLRKLRWDRAFNSSSCQSSNYKMNAKPSDLRATIIIEHIIQASDVSHTMQHWHVYQKWNRSLFQEMHAAYLAGRMGKDPSTFWYKGEIGFFDNYVIPLAKKLKECGVFGVSSDEYLNYALQNRAEWEQRGEAIVQSMVTDVAAASALMDDPSFHGEKPTSDHDCEEKKTDCIEEQEPA